MALDVKRAFLHAPVLRELYVELPDEAREEDTQDMIGQLHRAMYGTRDAAMNWQEEIAVVMI